ncbi:DUF397 domain-containing protein [Nocardiopsis sp. CA-288880]|uniref:DUF397 domain-containing protein n=1 Tax=Nocardiopsis sp. CA-288880 TaxID=3239995 RepID=UPI003D980ACC
MDTDTPRRGPHGGVRASRYPGEAPAVPAWFTSSHSAAETCCVEVAVSARVVRVRDSAHREGAVLGLAAPAWVVLVRSATGG